MVYKVSLVGTHGTGKTVLMDLVKAELKKRSIEAVTIEELSTQARNLGLPINQETTLASQLWILHSQFAQELYLSEEIKGRVKNEVIICDRGIDNYCYLEHSVGENLHAKRLTLGHMQHFPYNQIYLLPIINQEIANNDLRATDKQFQQTMDQKIRQFLNEYDIEHTILPIPDQEDSYRQIWVKTIVNQSLEDLNKCKTELM
jgi:thymidylate kinase